MCPHRGLHAVGSGSSRRGWSRRGSARETRTGWTVGIGGEYAFTNYVSAFAEYNYYDFGTRTLTFLDPVGAFNDNISIRERQSVAKVGLNFRWNPVGPAF